jgi:pyruvate/2-oxoglutarate dehydrogenase complex dihydrolipoamide acyltransferase (E2) component
LGSETLGRRRVHGIGGLSLEGDGRMSGDEDYAVRPTQDRGESVGEPDVQLDVPALRMEEIDLEGEDLQARVSVRAELADLVNINIGLDVDLGEVKLQIKGVEAQAQLKARLDNVRAIFSEVLASLQHSPQFFRQALETGNQTAGAPEDTTLDTEVVDETDDVPGPPTDGSAGARGEPDATEAARNKARDLGVDLSGLEGTGSGGRIVVRDVTQEAARGYNQGV